MNLNLFYFNNRLFNVLLLILFPFMLSAQDYSVKLKSRYFTPDDNIERINSESSVLKNSFFNDKHYCVIQFKQLPTQEEKDALAIKGIHLNEYIPSMAYTASISARTNISDLRSPLFRSIFNFSPQDKTSQTILDGETIQHAVKQKGFVDLTVITFEKLSPTIITKSIENINGRIIEDMSDFQSFTIRVPIANMSKLVALPFVQWVEYIDAPNRLENTLGRTLHRVNILNDGIRNLKGDDVNVGIWDGGEIGTHIDFSPAGRVTQVETSSASNHSTHCSGTILGRGIKEADGRGMAPNANLYSYNFSGNITTEMNTGIPLYNLLVSSHSYGSSQTCGLTGSGVSYSSRSRSTDLTLNSFPYHIHCHSAGNSQSGCTGGWSTITGSGKSAKNNILVAAISTSEVLASFSSCGPVEDGRVKPEISGLGTSVLSTLPNNSYASYSGTSMSTPGVAGSAALLVQRYKQLNSNALPPSSLIKNTILNTANDLGNAGPDYRYGYGRINALEAVKILETNRYVVNTITTGNTINQNIVVPTGAAKLRVMLTWNDPAGASNAATPLVNNLDLSVISGATTTLPWKLDKNNPSTVAFRGVDVVSNIEQVTIDNPSAGTYILRVNGLAVPTGPSQEYSLTWSVDMPNIEIIYPNGGERFTPGTSNQETITWNSAGVTSNQTIQYSLNNGTNWTTISSSVNANTRRYIWTPPSANTSTALIRITSGSLTDQSDATFSILNTPTGFAGNNNNTCNPGEINFTWNATTNATHYDILKLNPSTGEFDTLAINITGTNYTGTGMPSNSSMWFYIRSKNNTSGAISKRTDAINVTTSNTGIGPAAPGSITGNTTICTPINGVTYSINTVSGANTYTWTAPPGAFITSGTGTTNITVNYSAASTPGNLIVTAGDGTCTSNPSTLAILINTQPATPIVTTVDPICIGGTGNIDITSPLGANLEYSIDGSTYQPSTSFVAMAGTYSVTARVSGSSCISAASSVTLNPSTTNCAFADIGIGAFTIQASINQGGLSNLEYYVTNVGTGPSSGAITIYISKPTSGALNLTLPAGWSYVSPPTGSPISITTTNVILPGIVNRITIPATYQHNGANENAVKSTLIGAVPGSGGETQGTNNQSGTFILVN